MAAVAAAPRANAAAPPPAQAAAPGANLPVPQQLPQFIVPDVVEDRRTDSAGNIVVRKYMRGKLLGKGGFARCFAFTNPEKGRIVAGKVVDKVSLTKNKAKQKLLAEIKIHRSLSHRYVVGFESFFEDRHNVYIMLELCGNQSMMELVKGRRRLSEPEARYYALQLLDATRYLHAHSIIHRDLKLGNLFVCSDMEVRVGDFGLATQLTHPGERKRTICGTPNYIAPEILDGKEGHSFEVDVWALGVIIYTMIIGKPPFETADVKSTYKRIRENAYSFPEGAPISAEAVDLIEAILVPDPAARPSLVAIANHAWFTGPEAVVPRRLPRSAVKEVPAFAPSELLPGHVAVAEMLARPIGSLLVRSSAARQAPAGGAGAAGGGSGCAAPSSSSSSSAAAGAAHAGRPADTNVPQPAYYVEAPGCCGPAPPAAAVPRPGGGALRVSADKENGGGYAMPYAHPAASLHAHTNAQAPHAAAAGMAVKPGFASLPAFGGFVPGGRAQPQQPLAVAYPSLRAPGCGGGRPVSNPFAIGAPEGDPGCEGGAGEGEGEGEDGYGPTDAHDPSPAPSLAPPSTSGAASARSGAGSAHGGGAYGFAPSSSSAAAAAAAAASAGSSRPRLGDGAASAASASSSRAGGGGYGGGDSGSTYGPGNRAAYGSFSTSCTPLPDMGAPALAALHRASSAPTLPPGTAEEAAAAGHGAAAGFLVRPGCGYSVQSAASAGTGAASAPGVASAVPSAGARRMPLALADDTLPCVHGFLARCEQRGEADIACAADLQHTLLASARPSPMHGRAGSGGVGCSPMAVEGEEGDGAAAGGGVYWPPSADLVAQRVAVRAIRPLPLPGTTTGPSPASRAGGGAPAGSGAGVWVTSWVDYSSKYGVGYLLSNSAVGVYFNDSTKIVLAPDGHAFEYVERHNHGRAPPTTRLGDCPSATVSVGADGIYRLRATLARFPAELAKKVTLLRHFHNHLHEHYRRRAHQTERARQAAAAAAVGSGGGAPAAAHAGLPPPPFGAEIGMEGGLPAAKSEAEVMATAGHGINGGITVWVGAEEAAAYEAGQASANVLSVMEQDEDDDNRSAGSLERLPPGDAASGAAGGSGAGVGGDHMVFVKKYIRSRRCLMFRLSNRSVQLFFYDGSQLLLGEEGRAAVYTDRGGSRFAFSAAELLGARLALQTRVPAAWLEAREGSYVWSGAGSPLDPAAGPAGAAAWLRLCLDAQRRLRYAKDSLAQWIGTGSSGTAPAPASAASGAARPAAPASAAAAAPLAGR